MKFITDKKLEDLYQNMVDEDLHRSWFIGRKKALKEIKEKENN